MEYELKTKDGTTLKINWGKSTLLFSNERTKIEHKIYKLLFKLCYKTIKMNKKEYRKRRIAEIDKEIKNKLDYEWIGG